MSQVTTELALSGNLVTLDRIVGALPDSPALVLVEQVGTGWLNPADRDRLFHFERFTAGESFSPRTRGRVFGELFELRWEPRPDAEPSLRVRYIGVPAEIAGLAPIGCELEALEIREVRYDLWGERVDEPARVGAPAGTPIYAELRVPRLLRYPVSAHPRRVRLRVREYVDPGTGETVLSRFIGLVGEE